jgi:hypothetical protein
MSGTPKAASVARINMMVVCVLNALLFVRLAILYAPEHLLGPSGADRLF